MPESMDALKRRHNIHRPSGAWAGRSECHVANSGDWLVIWSPNGKVAFFGRTGSHDELRVVSSLTGDVLDTKRKIREAI